MLQQLLLNSYITMIEDPLHSLKQRTNILQLRESNSVFQKKLQKIKSAQNFSKNARDRDNHSIKKKFDQLKLLTRQKENLMKQLSILKEGAVTALLEKEQQIEKLRKNTQIECNFQDQKQQMQIQLNKLLRQLKDYMQENAQLIADRQKCRVFFFEQLYNKELVIDSHLATNANLENEIYNLKNQIEKLNQQLSSKQDKCDNLQIQLQALKLQFLNYKIELANQNQERNCQSPFCLEKMYNFQLQESIHKKEVEDLVVFYENRINVIQNLYERELNFKNTMDTQQYSESQQKDMVGFLGSTKTFCRPQLINLKSDLIKNLENTWKTDENSDNQSRFSTRYFDYHKIKSPIKLDSALKAIRFQENYQIKSNNQIQIKAFEQQKLLTKKNLIFGTCGFVVGAFTTHFLGKIIK